MSDRVLEEFVKELINLKAEREDLGKRRERIGANIQRIENEIRKLMLDQNIDQVRIPGVGSISMHIRPVPQVEDWDQFHEFIRANGFFHLLDKRPSVSGCREMFMRDEVIPGVNPFDRTSFRIVKQK